jgi:DNA-binding transcriptional MerR regulator
MKLYGSVGWDAPPVFAFARTPSGPGGGGSGAGGGSAEEGDGSLLSDKDLRQIEKDHPDGMTAVQVVHTFTERGIRFSEATFRKYVQQGLLPRSRRVGRKGKHQGSLGMYPPTTVRRINAIKRLQADNYTIEDIQKQFLRYRDEIEAIERSLDVVLGGFEEDVQAPHFDAETRKSLKKEVAEARVRAEELMKRIEGIERRVIEPHKQAQGGKVGPGGAEDLL